MLYFDIIESDDSVSELYEALGALFICIDS